MICTKKGEFDNFAHLRYAYLLTYDGNPPIQKYFNQDKWDATTLHISELGKCPRKQMLRLIRAEPKIRSLSALANDALVFYQGNMIHALTVGACYWAGIALSHEETLEDLPDGWSGHYDLIYEEAQNTLVAWDGKTVRPNAFNFWYSWPKIEERRQVQGYLRFLEPVHYGVIEHIDRGGSNKPFFSAISRDNEWVDFKMAELEHYRASLPELPDPLVPKLKPTYRKRPNVLDWDMNKIFLKNNWQCEWCEYHWATNLGSDANPDWHTNEGSPCKPEMKKLEVTKVSHGKLDTSEQYLDKVANWLRSQIMSFTHPDAELEEEELPF